MGNRLTRIYTRQGDTGKTGLGTNSRVPKNHPRIVAIGDVDELNSWIGHIRAALTTEHSETGVLSQIQHDLFDIGGELAMPGFELVRPEPVAELEHAIDRLNEHLPALENFILPAGGEATTRAHLARSVARRAERQCWALHQHESEHPVADGEQLGLHAIQYLNRLSDYLFVLARSLSRENDGQEVLWQSRHQER